ncbi:MAG: Cysteine desulfurase [uncultured Solirubrobacteraceae bacterium]|uniref:Cysteine desulfurase n=1 Tax=uncultured Solirubrobacteraceae bacterium TaxID=1162706 RepID=A0A6J4SS97_9ACTN|nr:MAG: Cysteine desulfurase [uncultured Solirubrobacteraceae bacterium]
MFSMPAAAKPLNARVDAAFERVPGHLDTATAGLPPRATIAAMRAALEEWAAGRLDVAVCDADVARCRAAFATLTGVPPDSVAIGAQVSVFASVVAGSLPAGARVLCAEGDFTSVLWPFVVQADRGVTVRSVPLEEIPAAIDATTDLVAVSSVMSADGRVADLDALAAAAAHHGARVFLDVTHGCGWQELAGSRFDHVVAAAYKWLLSPRGVALWSVRPDALEELVPQAAGWYAGEQPWESCYGAPLRLAAGARQLDLSPAWLCWTGAAPALELLAEIGPAAVGAHNLALASRLRTGLGQPDPGRPSAIVVTERPDATARLAAAGVRASVRAGQVRLSCHLTTTTADVDRALEALA